MFTVSQELLEQTAASLAGAANLYWVIGGSNAGKSTVCRAIATVRKVDLCDMDERVFGAYMGQFSWERHPASKSWFSADNSLEWILSLTWPEFDSLYRAANVEYLDLFAQEMAGRAGHRPLLVDGGITHPSILAQALPAERIFCIAVDPSESARAWNSHPERVAMKEMVLALESPEATWDKFLDFDRRIAQTIERESHKLGIKVQRRTSSDQGAELAQIILDHFGL